MTVSTFLLLKVFGYLQAPTKDCKEKAAANKVRSWARTSVVLLNRGQHLELKVCQWGKQPWFTTAAPGVESSSNELEGDTHFLRMKPSGKWFHLLLDRCFLSQNSWYAKAKANSLWKQITLSNNVYKFSYEMSLIQYKKSLSIRYGNTKWPVYRKNKKEWSFQKFKNNWINKYKLYNMQMLIRNLKRYSKGK